jgi:hypothetical protein
MNRFRKITDCLMSHSRDIRMEQYSDKIVYNIPKYMVIEKYLYTPQVHINNNQIELIFNLKAPISHHLVMSSYETHLNEKVNIDENEKSFQ